MSQETRYTRWNRRLHYFLGLYFLFFVWLFALTGLLLNHGWSFAEFWPTRKIATAERSIVPPPAAPPLEQARHLMRQLDVSGEIQWLAAKPDATRLEFRVMRPGRQLEIKADLAATRATLQQTDLNGWGFARILHTFTGVRQNDRLNDRDWLVTTLWAWSMDAVALGLVVMVVTGLLLWARQPGKRLPGLLALGSGTLACGWLLFALR